MPDKPVTPQEPVIPQKPEVKYRVVENFREIFPGGKIKRFQKGDFIRRDDFHDPTTFDRLLITVSKDRGTIIPADEWDTFQVKKQRAHQVKI
jgi:hypothetical protein